MRIVPIFVSLLASALFCGCGQPQKQVGRPLSPWEEGFLDIHAVNSARGECTFMIFPDGTTMTVDAGSMFGTNPKYANDLPKPDSLTRPEDLYASYMKHFMSGDSLDYFLLSHYHADHMGKYSEDFPVKEEGGYHLYGVSALYEELPFRTLLDRSFPEYGDSVRMEDTSSSIEDYVAFVEYQHSRGMKCGKPEPGRDDQIVLKNSPAAYPDFKVSCYSNSGITWDGSGLKDFNVKRENVASSSILISYGDFDYFTSGDNNSLGIIETVCSAIAEPVEALKCPHHMSNPEQVNALLDRLDPRVVVTQSFYVREIQPHQEIIAAQSQKRDLFFTNIDKSLTETRPEIYSGCRAMNGHVVIRVLPGGKQYRVFLLKDTDYSYEVLQEFGPYDCS